MLTPNSASSAKRNRIQLVFAHMDSHQSKYAVWWRLCADGRFEGLQGWWRNEFVEPFELNIIEHPKNSREALQLIHNEQSIMWPSLWSQIKFALVSAFNSFW